MKEFPRSLWPEITSERVEFADSLPSGFEKSLEEKFDLCFISSNCKAGLESFFLDMKTLGRLETCKFIQIGGDKSGFLMHSDISLAVSNPVTKKELSNLCELIKSDFARKAAEEKSGEVRGMVHLLLQEVERAVQNLRRGRPTPPSRVVSGYVKSQTSFDPSVFESYIDALATNADKVEPSVKEVLDVPETILRRKLPFLEQKSYMGVSRRVWEKMLRRFKEKEGETSEASAGPSEE